MNLNHFILTLLLLVTIGISSCNSQKKFKVVVTETGTSMEIYSLVDEEGKLIRQLDTAKYFICFNPDEYVYFAIFGMTSDYNGTNPGWNAIDADEKVLFNVYNTSSGEPSPDELIENKIRIVDKDNLIGFADNKGNIIIKPQFEIVSSFHNGKAILGKKCKEEPWDAHAKESDCHHYNIICEQHGYINTDGKVLKIGNYSFEQIMKEIDWETPDL